MSSRILRRSTRLAFLPLLRLSLLALPAFVAGCGENLASDAPAASDDAGAAAATDDGGGNGGAGGDSGGGLNDDGGTPSAADSGAPTPASDGGALPFGDGGPRTAAPCVANGTFGSTSTTSVLPSGPITMYECDPTGMEGKTSQAAPLVLALHGYTQGAYEAPAQGWTPSAGEPNSWGYIDTTQWATLAQAYGFYVIFPSTGNATSTTTPDTTARSFHWYASYNLSGTITEPTTFIEKGNDDEVAIMDMVTQMQQTHNIDPTKIFISGLSAGAGMANLMLAAYPDVFAGGASFEGLAVGCGENCAALGQAPPNGTWTWPGNHASSIITGLSSVWSDASAPKPKLLVFQGLEDGAVTPDNEADIVQQFAGAYGISTTPTTATTTYKGQNYTVYGNGILATMEMPGIGHGTPVQPGPVQSATPFFVVGAPPGPNQGGWDPMPSKTMSDNANIVQDWTNTVGIWGMYEAAKFWGIVP